MKECPEVTDLPYLTVEAYLLGQETKAFEQAQDEYMEVMQNLADIAFTLLLDTGLAESGDSITLSNWRKLGNMNSDSLAECIGSEWLDTLMFPMLDGLLHDPITFAQTHNEIIQDKAQEMFGTLTSLELVREAAELTMAMALFLAHSLGADAKGLSEHWIQNCERLTERWNNTKRQVRPAQNPPILQLILTIFKSDLCFDSFSYHCYFPMGHLPKIALSFGIFNFSYYYVITTPNSNFFQIL